MEKPTVPEGMLDKLLAPIKTVLDFLPEDERPSFDEFVQKFITVMRNCPTTKQKLNAYKFPPNFTVESIKWQRENWIPLKDDVLISTYPKTGTTWVTEIMRQVLYRGNDEEMKIGSLLQQYFTYLECSYPPFCEAYQKFPLKRRIYSTHLTTECINIEKALESGIKIICVLRNPKDQLVSRYNFTTSLPFYDQGDLAETFPSDWNKFFELFITGQQPTFCKDGEWYPHHILSWYPYRNHENVKFIYYEDLKKNPFGKIKELVQFVNSEKTDKEIEEIVQVTSFDAMKKKDIPLQMLRKGIVGDWKNKFTVAQSEMMDEKIKEALRDTDISFTYE